MIFLKFFYYLLKLKKMKLIIKKLTKISLKERKSNNQTKNQEWKYTYKKQNDWIKKNKKKRYKHIFENRKK